ncbi:hypothetical protein GIB67_021589 [Kingdonia uniflora]|uniref:DEUBAD domain-containing protein n=1 Tax=Kingdonia uniflora TaxID=39325 RepID=A0A7J7MDZ4_9MAGN|nr:hypothetical protein GIB67_021589 [Kingdonia uniflora]
MAGTPLWRNGPSEKPVLCNACGSRWRTKGTLVNYTPLHARAEYDDFEDYKVSKTRSTFIKIKEPKLQKRKPSYNSVVVGRYTPDNYQNFRRILDEDISNRSSCGSAISYSESCTQFGNADASSSQSVVWDTLVPSKKRTCFNHPKQSSIEKLRKDLCSILHEQQSSYFSGSSEEDLIYGSKSSSISDEIGHGSFLIKNPSSKAMEEESEASSLTLDYKLNTINEAHSSSDSLPVHIDRKGVGFSSVGIVKITKPSGQGMQDKTNSDNACYERLQVLRSHDSPLTIINLKDVLNFEEFLKNLTHEEQQLLMKYLPSIDTARIHDSLTSMFDSPQFAENLSSFQKLLTEGVFDLSFSGMNPEECKTLKRLALVNLTNSEWVEHYNHLKDVKQKQIIGEKGVATGPGPSNLTTLKRPRDVQNQNIQEPKVMMKSPKRVIMKACYDADIIDDYTSCFSPRSLFAAPPDRSSLMLDSLDFVEDNDLLFDVPSNGPFPQAELLHPFSSCS